MVVLFTHQSNKYVFKIGLGKSKLSVQIKTTDLQKNRSEDISDFLQPWPTQQQISVTKSSSA